jgi:hypothetical protein
MPDIPPGWYTDPHDQRYLRWWDGLAWSTHVSAASPSQVPLPGQRLPPMAGTPVDPYGPSWSGRPGVTVAAEPEERALTPWAKAAVIVYTASGAVSGLVAWAGAASWARYFHALRVYFHAVGTVPAGTHNLVAPQPPPGSYLLTPLILAAEVLFLLWQYRAAKTARALGYPARRSPGWGVGSYFVPVVNLWMPYQALRDCLPVGHVARASVLRAWLLGISTALINASLIFTLAEDRSVGVILLGVDLLALAALALNGWRVVSAIADVHEQAFARPG